MKYIALFEPEKAVWIAILPITEEVPFPDFYTSLVGREILPRPMKNSCPK